MRGAPLPVWWLVLGALATGAALLGVARIDAALPAPLTRAAPAHRFIADIAHEHLVNLTSIGPRVREASLTPYVRAHTGICDRDGRLTVYG